MSRRTGQNGSVHQPHAQSSKRWEQKKAWLLPNIGGLPLSDVTNKTARTLIEEMSVAGLSQKSIIDYFRAVVASAVNEEGDQIHPRNWNRDFIGLPIIQRAKQSRPTIIQAGLETILTGTENQDPSAVF